MVVMLLFRGVRTAWLVVVIVGRAPKRHLVFAGVSVCIWGCYLQKGSLRGKGHSERNPPRFQGFGCGSEMKVVMDGGKGNQQIHAPCKYTRNAVQK